MNLKIEFKENWVSAYDILALENIIGVPLDRLGILNKKEILIVIVIKEN